MEIILKAKLTGVLNGKPCKLQPYRAVLIDKADGVRVAIQQPFKDGSYGAVGRWYLKTLFRDLDDLLWLDYGQGWGVHGMKEALEEALDHVKFKFKRKGGSE